VPRAAFAVGGLVVVVLAGSDPAAGQPASDPVVLTEAGRYRVERDGRYTKLLADDILWATQAYRQYFHPLDALTPIGSGGPWDALALTGALRAWDPTLDPLSYYHRAGPVGAMFHVLRARGGPPPAVGVIGLHGGTPAAYVGPGQSVTFYEQDPTLKKLVVDTDRYFTYLADARGRRAAVEVRVGPVRRNLSRDADRKFGLLLVELYDTGFDPGDRLTLEAVRLYFDRVAADGIVALHISNKYFRLEPVVAAIAAELGLTGRVWNDDSESRPGKTASSWVALARDVKALGAMAAPATDQVLAFGAKNQALVELLRAFPPETLAADALARAYGPAYARYKDAVDQKAAVGNDFVKGKLSEAEARKKLAAAVDEQIEAEKAIARASGSLAVRLVEGVHKSDPAKTTLQDLTEVIVGPMFRPLKADPQVGVRHDGDTAWPAAVRRERPDRE
jgi:hypothetical protein